MRHFSTTLLYHPRNRVVDPSTEVLLRVTDLAPGPQTKWVLKLPIGWTVPLIGWTVVPSSSFIEPPPWLERNLSAYCATTQSCARPIPRRSRRRRRRRRAPPANSPTSKPPIVLAGFHCIATSVADPPLPACPRIDPHAHVHDPSSSDVSKQQSAPSLERACVQHQDARPHHHRLSGHPESSKGPQSRRRSPEHAALQAGIRGPQSDVPRLPAPPRPSV